MGIGKEKRSCKKIAVIMAFVAVILAAAFGIYVSDYYHALDQNYATDHGIEKTEYEDYIVYGDMQDVSSALIFYPGGKVEAESYEPILTKITESGINCVLVKMPFRLAVLKANAAKEVMEDFPEVEYWYIGGHSLGGAMAASFAGKNTDKIEALILLAAYPTDALSEELPILSLYGSNDQVLNREHYQEGMEENPQAEECVIEGGNHGGFGNYGQQAKDGTAKISSEEQWNRTKKEVMEFIYEN